MRSRTAVAYFALSIAACKKDPTEIEPSVRIADGLVVVSIGCTGYTDVVVDGKRTSCSLNHPAIVRIPAAKLGAGRRAIPVHAEMPSRAPIDTELAVDVPADATGPALTLDGCDGDKDGIEIGVAIAGVELACRTRGARVALTGRANPKAKLAIAGTTAVAADTGEIAIAFDLTGAILPIAVDAFRDAKKLPPLELPWQLDAGGRSIAGKVTVTQSHDYNPLLPRWLAELAAGKTDRRGFAPPDNARPYALRARRRLDLRDDVHLIGSPDHVAIRDIAWIAADREVKRTRDGDCKFDTSGGAITAARHLVDVEVTVARAHDGEVVAKRTFVSTPRCPDYASLDRRTPQVFVTPPDDEIDAWVVATIAQPPKP
jgi:hypothetical protein